jgi:hypothetical protein
MLYIYGDSHGCFNFKNLPIPHENHSQFSITMFRIGRDNMIINFDPVRHQAGSVICLAYGEVDCRCHIQRQVNLGRNEDDVIHELVDSYFRTIRNNISKDIKIIVTGVIAPTRQVDYEVIHGPILHEFPFIGSDADRVRYTAKTNAYMEELCKSHGYMYFNPYGYYTRDDGTLKHEMSDTIVHLGNNTYFLEQFMELYNKTI